MTTTQNQKSYVVPIAMMFFLFFIISFVTGVQNPFGIILKSQFHLSDFQSQFGNFANFLAYLCMGVPAGILLEKIGYKKTALASLVVGFLGVLIMYLSSFVAVGTVICGLDLVFWVYLLGAFVGGFSMCMLNTVVNPMLTVLGSKEGANQRLNFGGALNSIGATLAPILGGAIIGDIASSHISNARPVLYIAMGIFALVWVVLNLTKIPEPHMVKKDVNVAKDPHSALSFRHFKLGMVGVFIYVGIEVMFCNTTNLWLAAAVHPASGQSGLGLEAGIAGCIVSVYWLLMFVGRSLGGILGKTFTSKQMLTGVASLALIFVTLAILLPVTILVKIPALDLAHFSLQMVSVPISIMFLVLGGLCTSVMWPGTYNLATAGLGKYIAKGSGLFMMMVVGGGILPLIQGGVVGLVGYQASYWVLFASLLYMLWYALIGSKNVNTDINVD